MHPPIIGRIHANWCGHCSTLATFWDAMVKNILKKNPKTEFVDFESDEISKGKLKQFNTEKKTLLHGKEVVFSGFPTIFKIKNGIIEYYDDKREQAHLEEWAIDKIHNNKNILDVYEKHIRKRSKTIGGKKHRKPHKKTKRKGSRKL
jgi:hypothetical protein